jgi:peptidoglycan/xylan/chitin deacetylase (PgdA/CDA1 family)
MSLAEAAARLAMTVASRDRLSVLIYHRVPAQPDELLPGEPCAAEFERTMRWVKSVFNVIPLEEGVAGIKSGKLPRRALSITFDDGYANNATVAAPILKRLGLHATFFIATGFLDGGRMFNDDVIEPVRETKESVLDLRLLGLGTYPVDTVKRKQLAISYILEALKYMPEKRRVELAAKVAATAKAGERRDQMMTTAQVKWLGEQGFGIGAHTRTHVMLASTSVDEARAEIRCNKAELENMCGKQVNLFAYPNGKPDVDYSNSSVEVVKELGFHGAVSTSWGAAKVGSDPFQIPRFTPWDAAGSRFAARMLRNLSFARPKYVL